jgi:hypothetical protein
MGIIVNDPCQNSMDMLTTRCSRWLKEKHNILKPVFIDDKSYFLNGFPAEDIIDIVFFGSHLEKVLRSGNWNNRNYRCWVLSQSVKNMFTEVYGFGAEQVSVIPRYELFPIQNKFRRKINKQDKYSLVYSGRISPIKNIELLIFTYYFFIQQLKSVPPLYLIGPFDSEVLPGDKKRNGNYKECLIELINILNLDKNIIILKEMNPDQWIDHKKFINPILINFSTFLHEDFGVSVAQAQQHNWPIIYSEWGGHIDLMGDKLMPIPFELFENCHAHLILGYAYRLSQYCRKNLQFDSKISSLHSSGALPKIISQEELNKLRLTFYKKFSPQISLVEEYRHYEFFKTTKGFKYKKLLTKNFSQRTANVQYVTLIIDNINDRNLANLIISNCQINESIQVLQANELINQTGYSKLLTSNKIYILSSNKDFKDKLSNNLIRLGLDSSNILDGEKLKNENISAELQLKINNYFFSLIKSSIVE